MKIGKQPKRWGKPSAKFLEKKAKEQGTKVPVDTLPEWEKEPEAEIPAPVPEQIRIYLDDERPCPEGWVLCRTPGEFFKLLKNDNDYLDRVTHLSLDWYLGAHQVDGVEVAKRLAYMFFEEHEMEDKKFLPNLRGIGLHSSDRDAARRMYNELITTLEDIGRSDSIRIRRNTPTF